MLTGVLSRSSIQQKTRSSASFPTLPVQHSFPTGTNGTMLSPAPLPDLQHSCGGTVRDKDCWFVWLKEVTCQSSDHVHSRGCTYSVLLDPNTMQLHV